MNIGLWSALLGFVSIAISSRRERRGRRARREIAVQNCDNHTEVTENTEQSAKGTSALRPVSDEKNDW